MQQAITCTKVDLDSYHHMVLLGHNEFMSQFIYHALNMDIFHTH